METSELGGRFHRVWPEPVLLSSVHPSSKKNSLRLIWRGDRCQFSTQQPANLGSQQSSFLDPRVMHSEARGVSWVQSKTWRCLPLA